MDKKAWITAGITLVVVIVGTLVTQIAVAKIKPLQNLTKPS